MTNLNMEILKKDSSEKDLAVNKSEIAVNKSDIAVNKSDIVGHCDQHGPNLHMRGGYEGDSHIHLAVIGSELYIYIYIEFGQRPVDKLQSSFWPPAGMMIMIVIVLGARNHNYNYDRRQEL